jgi:hypothetical protein
MRTLATPICICVIIAASAAAQDEIAEVQLPPDTADVPVLPMLKGKSYLERCWVTAAGEAFRAGPGSTSIARGSTKRTTFMQGAYVFARAEVGKTTWVLLAEKDGGTDRVARWLGWVPAESIIARPNHTPLRDEETKIERKAMIVNKLGNIRKALDNPPPPLAELPAQKAEILDRGEVPAELVEKLKLSTPAVAKKGKDLGWLVLDALKAESGGPGIVRQWFDVSPDPADPSRLIVRDSLNQAAVFDRPDSGSGMRRMNFALFNVFFVYQKRNGFVLLGSAPQFGDADVHRVMHGWVPENRVTIWNTREALEWDLRTTLPGVMDRRSPNGTAFRDPVGAKKWLDSLLNDKDMAKARELADSTGGFGEVADPDRPGQSRRLRGAEMRFVVLGEEKEHPQTQAMLYRVGVAGPLVGGRQEVSAIDVAAHRERVNRAIEEMLTVEILFVIDGTGSMRRYFKTLQQMIRAGLSNMNTLRAAGPPYDRLRVRVAFAFYADGTSKPVVDVPRRLTAPGQTAVENPSEIISPELMDPARRGDADWRIRERIEKVAAELTDRSDMDSDNIPEEWVYSGIVEGIQKAAFGAKSTQLVFVMGDVGNDPACPVPTKAVLEALGSGARPKNLYVLHNEPPGETRHPAAARMEEQMKELTAQLRKITKGAAAAEYVNIPFGKDEDNVRQVGSLLKNRLDDTMRQIREDVQTLSEFAVGGIPAIAKPGLRRLLEATGVQVDFLSAGGVQVYEEGYIYDRVPVLRTGGDVASRVSQVRTVYKVAKAEADKLLRFLETLTTERALLLAEPEDFRRLVKDELKTLVGESELSETDRRVAEQSPAEFFKRVGGLKFKPAFLNKPDLAQMPLPTLKDRQDLMRVRAALAEVLGDKNQESDWQIKMVPAPAGGGAMIPTPVAVNSRQLKPEERRRYTDPANGTVWYWLDAEDHLP